MATAPYEISGRSDYAATRSPWRRIAERPFAPETLALYSALSFLFFGRNLIGHFSDHFIGVGPNPGLLMFFMEWWRYALAHHLNPFSVTAAWYPPGFNLALSTCVPLAAWALMPIEATLGPIAAYNVGILLCPALSAWSAFLLCRYVTRSYWPALVSGYVFGFSSYMLAHSMGHLDLTMVFLLPPAAYLVVRWLRSEVTDLKFVALFTLVLLGQFLSMLEVFAAMTLAGMAFLWLLWLWEGNRIRDRILRIIPQIALSFGIVALLNSPYLYYFFRAGSFPLASGWSSRISMHLSNFLVPAPTNIIGNLAVWRRLAVQPSIWEAGAYIGIPLLLVMWDFSRTRWNEPIVKALTTFFAIASLATFGPYLTIGNRPILPLPWLIIIHLPLLRMILPGRISVFIFLDLAIIASIWLASSNHSARVRIGAATAIIISLMPNLSASYWTSAADIPAFFSGGLFRKYLSPKETVVVLPYGYWGDSDLWLAQARMYFRMAGGKVGIIPAVPPDFDQYPIVGNLYNLVDIPDGEIQLKSFLVRKHVEAIIVADKGRPLYQPIPGDPIYSVERVGFSSQQEETIEMLFAGLGVEPIHVGGVSLYRVPLDKLKPYAAIAPETLQRRIAVARFATLLVAANRYVKHGYDLKSLTPLRAQELGVLPPRWVGGVYELPQYRKLALQDELLLGSNGGRRIAVGLLGPRWALVELAREYSRLAAAPGLKPKGSSQVGNAWIVPPGPYSAGPADTTEWVLLMSFQADELAQAAQAAQRILAQQAAHPLVN